MEKRKKIEKAATSLAYHSGRLLELFQWDDAPIDQTRLEERIKDIEGDVEELKKLSKEKDE